MKERNLHIDVAKGIGIILIVIGHMIGKDRILHAFIYSFHVPLFFFLSGLFINCDCDIKVFIKKTFKNILLPFINFSLIISFIHYLFGKEDTFRNLLCQSPGALWFLFVLFLAHCIWYFSYNISKRKKQEYINIIILGIVGYCLFHYNISLFHSISSIFTATFYLGIGYILRGPILNEKLIIRNDNKKNTGIISIMLFLLLLILTIIYNPHTDLSNNHLNIIGYIYSFIGIIATLLLSHTIKGKAMIILSNIGQKSLIIMAVHMQFIFLSTIIIKPFIEFYLLYKILEFNFVWIFTLLTAHIVFKRFRWIIGK